MKIKILDRLLLLATALLEGLDRLRYFALALFLVCLGFGLTLNIVNVDALIVRQNLTRALQQHELDAAYLASLSDDAIPVLFESLRAGKLPPFPANVVRRVLACQSSQRATEVTRPWQSSRPAQNRRASRCGR